jgi:sirohydrochlorin ferrochelatase
MRAILYIGHGTRSKKGADEAKAFLNRVIEAVSAQIQEISFLELTKPFIDEGFTRCVERGATSICVVPVFLLSAGHIKTDIPQALKPLRQKYPHIPVEMAEPFGVRDDILNAMIELIRDTVQDTSEDDSVLIVGRGSSDPAIHQSFKEIAHGVRARLKTKDVHVCYLAATTPTFREGMEHLCGEAKGRVIVVPYLLFEGLLLTEMRSEVQKRNKNDQSVILTPALGKHPTMLEIMTKRVTNEEVQHAAAHH